MEIQMPKKPSMMTPIELTENIILEMAVNSKELAEEAAKTVPEYLTSDTPSAKALRIVMDYAGRGKWKESAGKVFENEDIVTKDVFDAFLRDRYRNIADLDAAKKQLERLVCVLKCDVIRRQLDTLQKQLACELDEERVNELSERFRVLATELREAMRKGRTP